MGVRSECADRIFFGSPAVSRSRPVALRTGLATGVPLSEGGNPAQSHAIRIEADDLTAMFTVIELWQPRAVPN
jgi:hypothetical protein